MIPIKKLLSRIRWDTFFSDAYFEIEYEDRIAGMIRIPFDQIFSIDSLSFSLTDHFDRKITIPFHRIKRVYRNGENIWSRS